MTLRKNDETCITQTKKKVIIRVIRRSILIQNSSSTVNKLALKKKGTKIPRVRDTHSHVQIKKIVILIFSFSEYVSLNNLNIHSENVCRVLITFLSFDYFFKNNI